MGESGFNMKELQDASVSTDLLLEELSEGLVTQAQQQTELPRSGRPCVNTARDDQYI